jgi:imidazolonepropionase-like amidohydrolase
LIPLTLVVGCATHVDVAAIAPPPPRVAPPAPASDVIAFAGVELVPMDGDRVVHRQTVLVRGRVVIEVGDADRVAIPPGATIVDGRGAYLAPGLADMHVHLYDAEGLSSYLAYGVTTVANLNGSPADLALREAVASGSLEGPTIYTAGPSVNGDPPGNATFVAVMDAEGGRRVVDEQVAAGYDFIKVYSTLAPAAYEGIVDEARAKNIAVLGHIPWCVGAERVLAGHQSDVAHIEEFLYSYFHGNADDASRLPDLARLAAASGKTVTPNLFAYSDYLHALAGLDAVLADPEMRFASPALYSERLPLNNRSERDDKEGFAAALRKGRTLFQKITKTFSDAGVPLLVGTDTEVFGFPGQSAILEMQELRDAGLTPYQVMVAATRAAGEYVTRWVHPQGERFGVIAPGARADLLLLDGNPLESLDHLRALRGVMARGQWLPAARIKELRAERELANAPLRFDAREVEKLVGEKNFDEATTRLEALHRQHPTAKIEAEIVLADYARRAAKTAPAAAARLRELNVALYPSSFSAHTAAGRTYLRMGDLPAARRHLEQATAMSPNDVVARDLLDRVNLAGTPPSFDPVGRYDLSVAARKPLCGAETTLAVTVEIVKRPDGTYAGNLIETDEDAASARRKGRAKAKKTPWTEVVAAADRMWLRGDGPSLTLVVERGTNRVHGRYVAGFGSNFPLSGVRAKGR